MPLTLDRGFLWQAAPESADASKTLGLNIIALYYHYTCTTKLWILYLHYKHMPIQMPLCCRFIFLFVRLNELGAKAFTVSLFLVEFS